MKTTSDEILDEIRRIRDEHAAAFGYDPRRIGDDYRRQERESGVELVRLRPRKPRRIPRTAQT